MRVVGYPADRSACGHLRIVWPMEILARAGHDMTVVPSEHRMLPIDVHQDGTIHSVHVPEGTSVVVLQRVTHRVLAAAVKVIRDQGVAVVIDVDDDLSTIHPGNPAFRAMHPKDERYADHSWRNLVTACRDATLVTATTQLLLDRYAPHGRGMVIPNYLPDHYFNVPYEHAEGVLWPASLHSHPNDPDAMGNALRRLEQDGEELRLLGHPNGTRKSFGLQADMKGGGPYSLTEWPAAVASGRVGIAPLADTRFNAAKSWLKPLEMSALGVPWVASPRAEYTRLHRDYGAGLLAEKPADWYRKIRLLLDDDTARKEISEAGRAAADQLRLVDHAWRFAEAWDAASKMR